MSVILECQPGDTFVCIEPFHASPDGAPFSWNTCRTFRIGEKLAYVAFRRHENLKDHPSGWLVVFEAADRKRYAATQTYFVTEDCWRGIHAHFLTQLRRMSKRLLGSESTTPKSNKSVIKAKKPTARKKKAG